MPKLSLREIAGSAVPGIAVTVVALKNLDAASADWFPTLATTAILTVSTLVMWWYARRHNRTREAAIATVTVALLAVSILGVGLFLRYKATHDVRHGGFCIDLIQPVAADPAGAPLICASGEWRPVK